MFLEHQISILELILKDRVTLKTGDMTAESSALPKQEQIIKPYIKYSQKSSRVLPWPTSWIGQSKC